jgi:uncharacterized protein YdhG (YjbR/CyaY superfamily)
MKSKPTSPQNIDQYIADFPADVQEILHKLRVTIKKAAPKAEEGISYKMPSFNLNGQYLIYFAGYKKHIGLYPVPSGDEEFNKEISGYQAGKGTLRFPLDKSIPYKLISKIVKVRAKEISAKAAKGKKE